MVGRAEEWKYATHRTRRLRLKSQTAGGVKEDDGDEEEGMDIECIYLSSMVVLTGAGVNRPITNEHAAFGSRIGGRGLERADEFGERGFGEQCGV